MESNYTSVTINYNNSNGLSTYKTFNVHKTDTNHKSYGYMVGYIEALETKGVEVMFVDNDS